MPRSVLAALMTLVALAALPDGTTAQEKAEPDRRALDAARTLAERGSRPGTIAAEMASRFRQDAGQTAAILRRLRVRADAAGAAVASAYRVRGEGLVRTLSRGGFGAREIVASGERLRVGAGDLARGLRSGGVPAREVVGAFRAGGRPAEDAATGLRQVRVSPAEAAEMVKESYGALEPLRVRRLLTDAGYDFEAPSITRYWIADFRRLGSNDRIENLGVVDPARVSGPGAPTDGVVTIEGTGLDAPGTTVFVEHPGGVTEGEVRAASGGALEVELADFGSGELVVEGPGGRTSVPVLALSWAEVTAAQLFDPRPGFLFQGSNALVSWGFDGSQTVSPAFGTPDDVGITVNGQDPEGVVTAVAGSGHDLTVEVVFEVPTVISGTITPMVNCWTCGDFQIQKTVCDVLTVACIAEHAAAALTSALQCSAPENWREAQLPGVPIPVQGSGASVVTYRAHLDFLPDGSLLPVPVPGEYAGAVWNSVPLPPAQASFAHARIWWENVVVPAFLEPGEALAEAVAARVSAPSQYLPGITPGTELTGIHVQQGGAVRLAFRH